MCYFITLIARGSNASEIAAIAMHHRRNAQPVKNPSVHSVLKPGEDQYLTTTRHCDCGTALASSEVIEPTTKYDTEKMRAKGWSEGKIHRWVEEKNKALGRRLDRQMQEATDEFELWENLLTDLLQSPNVSGTGLMLHFYSGGIETEEIQLSRSEVSINQLPQLLREFPEDQIVMFS